MANEFDVFTNKFAYDIFKQKYSMDGQESWEETCTRVVNAVCGQYLDSEDQDKILQYMIARKFIPGGRYLYASGRPYHQINNCMLFRAEDSREGWADLMHKITATLMTGAGIGGDYSLLREEGAKIRRTGGESTGPIALMHMVNEAGRYIMQGGARRCLPTGTLISAKRGLIPIEDIVAGEFVLTSNGYHKVTGKVYQGAQKTIKIRTQNGELICTPNHRVAILNSVDGDYDWIEAQYLQPGDRLKFINDAIDGTKTQLPANDFLVSNMAYSLNRITIPELDEGIAWLIGLIHGDGHVSLRNDKNTGKRHGRVSIACSKDYPSIKDKAVEQLSRFGISVKTVDGDGNCWNVIAYSVELAYYLSKFKTPKSTIIVPTCIKRGLAGIRFAYLAGLMDSDGSIKTRPTNIATSIYKDFLIDIQNLCSSLGFCTRIKTIKRNKTNWQDIYQLNVSGTKQHNIFSNGIIPYSNKATQKINKVEQFGYTLPGKITNGKMKRVRELNTGVSIELIERELGSKNFTPVSVIGIENHIVLDTWDIEVAGPEEFIVNGYLVHNSAIWAGLSWKHPDIFKYMSVKDWSSDMRILKEKDFNFPLPMEGTNISVIYDTDFFVAIENKKHELHKHAKEVWKQNCLQAFRTAEPGFSFNFLKDNESLRNACTEVVSEDDSDKCNLGTIWINRFEDKEDFGECCKYAVKFLMCGGIYSDVPTEKIKEVGSRNNRIGLGLGGLHEWLLLRGQKYEVTPELHKWLNIYEHESDASAFITARELNVAKPKGVRAIAPTGTIGIIAETTTGIEPLFCKAYKRRYLVGQDWHYQYVVDGTVKRLLDKGVPVEKIQDAYDISFLDRVKFQADVNNYVDMSISSTCNISPWGSEGNNEQTLEKYSKILLKYAKRLRGFTCYPDGCRGGQPLTRVELEEALSNEGVVFKENEHQCIGGVCGV